VQLFHNMTALDNVRAGCHSWTGAGPYEAALRIGRHRREETAITDAARHWLEFVGLSKVARQPAGTLPFGHQRLLELARAMAARPRVLLLDEPAAGLNRVEKDALVRLLRRIQGLGVTQLLVEHDMTVVMGIAEHIVVLDHGAVIARGSPLQVRNNDAVVQAYLGAPA
jgi:branched-chain amino acid transport system ATP-binding protein